MPWFSPAQLLTRRWRRGLLGLGLAGGVLLLEGCSSGWRTLTPPGAAKAAPAHPAPETPDEAALENRVKAYAHFASGVVHDMKGESEDAQKDYWAATVADPGNEPLAVDLAHRLLQRQQAERAAELLGRAAAQPRASGLVYAWLGLAQAKAGKLDQAIAADRTAIKKAPRLLLGYQNLARLYFQRKLPTEGLKVLDEAAKRSDVAPGFLVEVADMLVSESRAKSFTNVDVKPRALALLGRAAKLKPREPLLLQRMAELYKAMGEVALATAVYRDLLEQHSAANPAVIPLLRDQLLQLYLRGGDRTNAAEQLKAIVRDNPTNPQAYFVLGNFAADEKKFAEAAEDFRKVLLLNPDFEPAYYDLARMELALNHAPQALETLEKVRQRFKPGFALEFYTGVALASQKRYAEAIKSYTAAEVLASASDPSQLNHVFYFQLAAACERQGDAAEAEKHFRKCLGLSPDYAEALNYLGYMWAERGTNLAEAHGMIAKAVKAEPKNAAFLDSLAWVLFKLGRAAEALPQLEEAIKHSETPDATLYDHLGDIQAALGNREAALAAWRKSLAIEPNEAIQKKLLPLPGVPTS